MTWLTWRQARAQIAVVAGGGAAANSGRYFSPKAGGSPAEMAMKSSMTATPPVITASCARA